MWCPLSYYARFIISSYNCLSFFLLFPPIFTPTTLATPSLPSTLPYTHPRFHQPPLVHTFPPPSLALFTVQPRLPLSQTPLPDPLPPPLLPYRTPAPLAHDTQGLIRFCSRRDKNQFKADFRLDTYCTRAWHAAHVSPARWGGHKEEKVKIYERGKALCWISTRYKNTRN